MNRISINRSWLRRGTWGAALLLLGLLLGAYEPARLKGDDLGGRSTDQSKPCVTGTELTAIGDEAGLKAIAKNLSGNYCLTQDIRLRESWKPLGTFFGTLDGKGYTINGLTIDNGIDSVVGLFKELEGEATVKNLTFYQPNVRGRSYTGVLAGASNVSTVIKNLKIEGGAITSNSGYTGGLVAWSYGTIESSYTTAAVSGDSAGGLVGLNGGIITNSYATGTARGFSYTGGLVGLNGGTITNSYARGEVRSNDTAGGLVGYNGGTITSSYATGTVRGGSFSSGDSAGGLVGYNEGTITNSYARGVVRGNPSGGLVGSNRGTIENSYATGVVTGTATGALTGQLRASTTGGLVGNNNDTITNSYYDKASTKQSDTRKSVGVSAEANIERNFDKHYDNGGTHGDTSKEIFLGWSPAIWTFATGKWPTLTWQTEP